MATDFFGTQVRKAVRRAGIDPLKDSVELNNIINYVREEYVARADAGLVPSDVDFDQLSRQIRAELTGAGVLQGYLDDDSIEEVWVNGPGQVFISRGGRSELTTTILESQELEQIIERLLRASGRRLDLSSPFVDAQLRGGERLHVVIPPITAGKWAVNIRKHVAKVARTADLVRLGSLTAQAARFLDAAVAVGLNVVVSGATQAGKTTMVRALAAAIPPQERVVTCEEVFELGLRNRDCVAMQTRSANIEDRGEIPLRRLIKESLRMRPNRLLIGEVREAEALDLLIAMNSGLPSMSTIHANSAREAVVKLCTLPLLAGENVSAAFVVPTVASCVDLVVHLNQDRSGRRRVEEIASLSGRVENGVIELASVYKTDSDGVLRRGLGAPDAQRFSRAGFDLSELLRQERPWG